MLAVSEWPEYDESKTIDATVELAVQINGKVRSTVKLPLDCPRDEALAAAKADERIAAAIGCNVGDFFAPQPTNTITCPHCGKLIKVEKGE